MCSLWSQCSGLHKSSQNAFVKPNKDWCWLQWLWSGRWSVNHYSWSRLGLAGSSTTVNSEARREICLNPPLLPAHFMPLNNSPSNNHRPLQWTCTTGMFGSCSWANFKTPTFLQLLSLRPSISVSSVCPQMSARGTGWGRAPSAQTRTSHQWGADTGY